MGKTIVISCSGRRGGNTDAFADEIVRGLRDNYTEYTLVQLREKEIGFCAGCLACIKDGKCSVHDDMPELMEQVKEAENLVIVTPIYYYALPGQTKVFIDRLNPLFEYKSSINLKNVYLCMSCADSEKSIADFPTQMVKFWADAVDGVSIKESYLAVNCYERDAFKNSPEDMEYAYNLGKRL